MKRLLPPVVVDSVARSVAVVGRGVTFRRFGAEPAAGDAQTLAVAVLLLSGSLLVA